MVSTQVYGKASVQDRQLRAKTEAYERETMREAIRATSEVRREVTPQVVEQKMDYSSINSATQKAEEILNTHRYTNIGQKTILFHNFITSEE